MTYIIIGFGAAIAIAGIVIMVSPELIFGYMHRNAKSLYLHIIAVLVRTVLGVLLIVTAGVSRYPLVLEILGWLSLIAALILALIGRHNFTKLISWALKLTKPLGRVSGAFALLFGAFLIYAYVW